MFLINLYALGNWIKYLLNATECYNMKLPFLDQQCTYVKKIMYYIEKCKNITIVIKRNYTFNPDMLVNTSANNYQQQQQVSLKRSHCIFLG